MDEEEAVAPHSGRYLGLREKEREFDVFIAVALVNAGRDGHDQEVSALRCSLASHRGGGGKKTAAALQKKKKSDYASCAREGTGGTNENLHLKKSNNRFTDRR